MDIATVSAWVTLVKDIVLTVGAIAAVVAGIGGLNTWKRQYKGQISYDLARRIIHKMYVYKDNISELQNEMVYILTFGDTQKFISEESEFEHSDFLHAHRLPYLEKYIEAQQTTEAELKALFVEANVQWQDDLTRDFRLLEVEGSVVRINAGLMLTILRRSEHELLGPITKATLQRLDKEYALPLQVAFRERLSEATLVAEKTTRKFLKR